MNGNAGTIEGNSGRNYVQFTTWTGDRQLATIGTNTGSMAIPFQGWRSFKEAFAPELIRRAVEETGSVRSIVDPFGGSGTTALAAQFLGARPTTIEVNPFLADLIEAKIARYDFESLVAAYSLVRRLARGQDAKVELYLAGAPATFLEPGVKNRYLFSVAVASRFFAYRAAISQVRDVAARRLLDVLLTGLAVTVSNAVVSGKGRRYRRNWQDRPIHPDRVDELFEKVALEALHDVRRFDARRCREYKLFRGDARTLIGQVGEQDLSVFSPPYPNSFDYTDVYNIELWMGNYLKDWSDNRNLRNATLRSHVQILRSMEHETPVSALLSETTAKLQDAQERLWNKNIPAMVGAYFDDMGKVLKGLRATLRKNGRVYMVVGDSKYAGIDVPVGKILAEQAPVLGYQVITLEPFRSMRTSPQQGGLHELPETLIVLQT